MLQIHFSLRFPEDDRVAYWLTIDTPTSSATATVSSADSPQSAARALRSMADTIDPPTAAPAPEFAPIGTRVLTHADSLADWAGVPRPQPTENHA